MSSLEQITRQVEEIKARQAKVNDDLLNEIGTALAELVEAVERSNSDQMAVSKAIIDGLSALSFKSPDVHVEVQMPPPPPPKGFSMTVVERDGNGSIRKIILKPEA